MPAFQFCPWCAAPLVASTVDGEARQVCGASCGFVHYDNPTPVVAAIVQLDDDVVLVRSRAWEAAWFGLVTGFLERDEAPDEAVVREVREELGLEVTAPVWIGNYAFAPMNQVILAYHVVARGEVVLGDELAAFKRVPIARLRPWAMGTGQAVADWLASVRGGVVA